MYNYYLIYANNQALLCSLTIFRAVFMLVSYLYIDKLCKIIYSWIQIYKL